MFFIRTVFWLSLVILLLPVSGNNTGNILGAAKHAFNGTDQFCHRNIDVCNISQEAWKSFKYKAAYSFEKLSKLAKDFKAEATQSYSPVYRAKPDDWPTASLEKVNTKQKDLSANTLTGEDLEPAWSFKPKRPAT